MSSLYLGSVSKTQGIGHPLSPRVPNQESHLRNSWPQQVIYDSSKELLEHRLWHCQQILQSTERGSGQKQRRVTPDPKEGKVRSQT